MTEFLEPDDIVNFNRKVLGGTAALRDRGLLESAVERPKASAFGEDAYPTLAEKAAALLHSLARNHPFVDGNKRSATLAMLTFLELNSVRVKWNREEAIEFIIAVAEGKHDVPAIAAWLEANTEPMP
jgi:death-on-curing protein